MSEEREVIFPDEIKAKRDELLREIERIVDDLELLRQVEEFHRQVSALSSEEMHRPFTI